MTLTPKNWSDFQHYKDRKPSWIKLHRSLLDDYEFSRLPVASRALAPLLWLLASEYEGGSITGSEEELAFRLRMSVKELRLALSPLIESGFFIASEPLADCKQSSSLEKEREREKETEKDISIKFEKFWNSYPRRVAKKAALKAFSNSIKETTLETILSALAADVANWREERFIPHPATWLNGGRYLDRASKPTQTYRPPGVTDES